MDKRIILLSGKRRSGKNTVGNLLRNRLPGKTKMMAFANKVKERAWRRYQDLNYFVPEHLFLKKEHFFEDKSNPLARKLTQIEGAAGREFDQDYWIDLAMSEIANDKYSKQAADNYIFTDCRFPNEIETVNTINSRELGNLFNVITVRIENPLRQHDEFIDSDISETALDGILTWDYQIVNAYDPAIQNAFHHNMEELVRYVDIIVQDILEAESEDG